jgi:hypothetical protein
MNLTNKIRWPKKGDDPFLTKYSDPKSPTFIYLDWLTSAQISDSLIASAFKDAADKIINELRRKSRNHPDIYFFPIMYLYRHCLELKIKEIIRLGIRLLLIEKDDKAIKTLNGHKLHPLWNLARCVIQSYWNNTPKNDIDATGRIIQEFHKIDKSGQLFRYARDTSGKNRHNQMPESIELIHVKDIFDAAYNFLDGCEAGLYEALQYVNQE